MFHWFVLSCPSVFAVCATLVLDLCINEINLHLQIHILRHCSFHCKIWDRTWVEESLLQNTTFTRKHFCLLCYLHPCSLMCVFHMCFSQGYKDLPSQISPRSQVCMVPRVCAGIALRFRGGKKNWVVNRDVMSHLKP